MPTPSRAAKAVTTLVTLLTLACDLPPTDDTTDSNGDGVSDPGTCDDSTGDPEPSAPQCDLFTQDCPEGEKCLPYASVGPWWDATICTPVVARPSLSGDPCVAEAGVFAGVDDCAEGTMCLHADPANGFGVCVDLCSDGATPCEDPSTTCVVEFGDNFAACLPVCDPLLQDCGSEQHCAPSGDDWACLSNLPDPGVQQGEPCEVQFECGQGLVCLAGTDVPGCTSDGCCAAICDLTDASGDQQCPDAFAGAGCEPWYPEGLAPAGYEDVGACRML